MRIADIPKHALVTLVRAYKYVVSPLLPSACRYVPTCSEYAMEAIDRHGVVLGTVRAGARLVRCHPWARGGFDPVPLVGVRGNSARARDLISRTPAYQEGLPIPFSGDTKSINRSSLDHPLRHA